MDIQIDVLEKKMNEAGGKNLPFLFGINFEMNEGFFIDNPLLKSDILFSINGVSNSRMIDKNQHGHLSDYHFEIFPEEFDIYKQRFQTVMEGLKRGESYLANLTIQTPLKISLTLEEIFLQSKSRYRLLIPDRFVCFSPECFIKISDGRIYSFPMKGTIDAAVPDAEETILTDEKETAEHNTIVDLLRNDLSSVAQHVHVNRFRYIDELQTNRGKILQVSSEIEGSLPKGYMSEIGTILLRLLPAGSVSGAPKEATLKIIGDAERKSRGYFTGVAGYFDGKNLDSFVLIRFIEKQENGFSFRSGGGITAKSDINKEYFESLQKVYLPF